MKTEERIDPKNTNTMANKEISKKMKGIEEYLDETREWDFEHYKNNTMEAKEYNIQNEVQKIHAKYGYTEKASYEIQLLFDKVHKHKMQEVLEEVEKITKKHPYKQRGNAESYSQYNEGWSDACDAIEQTILTHLKNKTK